MFYCFPPMLVLNQQSIARYKKKTENECPSIIPRVIKQVHQLRPSACSITVRNAWVLYKKVGTKKGTSQKLADFRIEPVSKSARK